MKIYDTHTAPTPRRVRIFLAEKNIPMEYVQLDLQKGENITAEMRLKNPIGKVPVLELDDGTCISESVAICRYFEALQPEPRLMGTTPLEQAQIEMWQRQVEFSLFMQIGMCFQHSTGYFKDRMTPVAEYGAVAGDIANRYLKVLERRLGESEFVAGKTFSIADITTLCAIDFGRVVKVKIKQDQINLARWYQQISQRPSASA
ncbi:glutathione S-transferase family protein [Aliiglaciecola sp. LCG003]|uniref:glutathione S-transferase family protein n=1 Tax=Aliiglaciecola sp. LCG003 TaxID=3053655 RepID=UPI0025738A73|nr:glutathione S-transferase family protein [Aliiglaciecola sp. LCG003]WJG11237.1 glutathione S-transferase family protein [Aliiglaciecola sp. LCG003]